MSEKPRLASELSPEIPIEPIIGVVEIEPTELTYANTPIDMTSTETVVSIEEAPRKPSRAERILGNIAVIGKFARGAVDTLVQLTGEGTKASAIIARRGARTTIKVAKVTSGATKQTAKIAGVNIIKKVKDSSHNTHEELKKDDAFYSSLGKRAVSGLGVEEDGPSEIIKPRTRLQQRRAIKLERKIEARNVTVAREKWETGLFGGRKGKVAVRQTRLAQKREYKELENAFKSGAITGRELIDRQRAVKAELVYDEHPTQKKLRKRVDKSLEDIPSYANPKIRRVIRKARIGLNSAVSGDKTKTEVNTAATSVDRSGGSAIEQELALSESTPHTKSSLDVLRRMSDEGLLDAEDKNDKTKIT